MYFDTHAHYDDPGFDADRDAVLAGLPEKGVELVVNPGCDIASSKMALGFASSFPFVYAAAGIHPENVADAVLSDVEKLRHLLAEPKAVALGEIGLDYYYDGKYKEKQNELLYAQMELARELSMPVIIHDRDAHEDCMRAVRNFPGVRGVFHCYSGSIEMAKELVRLGWYISFTGAVTFKNARRAPEVIAWLPPDRIMAETDSPYMAPEPFRGKRCDSGYLPYIINKIAEIRDLEPEAAAELTLLNGKTFFNIK